MNKDGVNLKCQRFAVLCFIFKLVFLRVLFWVHLFCNWLITHFADWVYKSFFIHIILLYVNSWLSSVAPPFVFVCLFVCLFVVFFSAWLQHFFLCVYQLKDILNIYCIDLCTTWLPCTGTLIIDCAGWLLSIMIL